MIRSGLYTWKEISCAILLSILHKNIAGVFTRIKILLQVILRKFLARVRSALFHPESNGTINTAVYFYDVIISVLIRRDEERRIASACTVHDVTLFGFASIARAINRSIFYH